MHKKLLIVYNICGISGTEPVEWYKTCIDSILRQSLPDCSVLISSCLNSENTKNELLKEYGHRINYNFIDERLTVNQTFNHSCREAIKRLGPFEGYLYVDSGIFFAGQINAIKEGYDLFNSGGVGMVTFQANNDTGFPEWLGFSGVYGYNAIIPVGRACNLHCQIFSHKLFEAYDNLIPDIFVAYCTESVFSFMCAAIQTQWIILKDVVLHHNKSIDGATSGFSHQGPKRCSWNNLWGGKDIHEILNHPDARISGFGYEELQGVFNHDPSQFDENQHCKNDLLKKFIKKQIFLSSQELDYSKIKHKWI